jgi:two-component system response regulator HydG
VLCEQTRIDVGALPPALAGAGDDKLDVPPGELPLPEILEELEKQLIKKAYEKAGKVKTETARLLGIKPGALYYKLEKYRIG